MEEIRQGSACIKLRDGVTVEFDTDKSLKLSTDGGTVVLPAGGKTSATLTGTETLTNKTLTSPTLTTPALGVATATSVNGVTVQANMRYLISESLATDLSNAGALTILVMSCPVALTVVKCYLFYSEASSSDAGVTLLVGKTGDTDWLYTGDTEISKSVGYIKDLTLLHTAMAAGEDIIVTNPGSKTGTGEIRAIIVYTLD